MKSYKSDFTVLLIIAILIILNIIANQFYFRLDFSEGKQYTLNKATKDILKNLEEPVTVKAYFSEDLPPQLLQTRRDFQDMLVDTRKISNGQVIYEFINPTVDEKTESETMQTGIQPVVINV